MALLRVVNESAESGKSSGSLNKKLIAIACAEQRICEHGDASAPCGALPYHGRAVLFSQRERRLEHLPRRGRGDAFTARVGVFVYRVLQSIYIPHEAVNAAETGIAGQSAYRRR